MSNLWENKRKLAKKTTFGSLSAIKYLIQTSN